MAKKKSYMDINNILSEGKLWSFIANLVVPQGVIDKYKKASDAKIEKYEKELEVLAKKQDDAQERMFKALEKQTGKKVKRKPAKDAIADYFEKRRK